MRHGKDGISARAKLMGFVTGQGACKPFRDEIACLVQYNALVSHSTDGQAAVQHLLVEPVEPCKRLGSLLRTGRSAMCS